MLVEQAQKLLHWTGQPMSKCWLSKLKNASLDWTAHVQNRDIWSCFPSVHVQGLTMRHDSSTWHASPGMGHMFVPAPSRPYYITLKIFLNFI